SSTMQISSIGRLLFVAFLVAGGLLAAVVHNAWPFFITGPIAFYLLFAIKVANKWEKVALLRLGRYVGLRGPGMFHMIPIIDSLSAMVDQRVRVAYVT